MGRQTTQLIRIGPVSGRMPRVQMVLEDHAARRPWPAWARKALYVLGAALVLLAVGAMLGTAFHEPVQATQAASARGEQ